MVAAPARVYPLASLVSTTDPSPLQLEARRRGLRDLARRLGHEFEDLSLLDRALTHASTGNEGLQSYERLEFLGDAFLNFASADWLYRSHPEIAEGELTETRTRIVSRAPLAAVGRRLALHELLLSGKGMRDTERCSDRILADLVEAVLGAILLDGGVTSARAFVRRHVLPRNITAAHATDTEKDSKTALLHHCQRLKLGQPRYELLETKGLQHEQEFRVVARLEDGRRAEGTARTKRAAEKIAAERLLARLLEATGSD